MKKIFLAVTGCLLIAACGQHNDKNQENNAPQEVAGPGKQLFAANCAQCHAISQDRTGPALSGVIGRWGNDTAKIIAFVKNSQQVIKNDGENSYTGKLFIKWYKAAMPAQPLSDGEIKDVLNYIETGKAGK